MWRALLAWPSALVALSANDVGKMVDPANGPVDASIRALWAGKLTRTAEAGWTFQHQVSLIATLSITAGPVKVGWCKLNQG